MVQFDGVPFSIGEKRTMDCQYGQQYYKPRTTLNKRVRLQGTRKMGCKAHIIPYSRKYWRALNLAVEPKIAIERILADLNLAVRYGIAIRIYASRKFWRILIWRL